MFAGAAVDLSIFRAFPNAIVSEVWSIGESQHGTIVGNVFKKYGDLDVVVDEGSSANISSRIEELDSDLLIYARPEQMPTLSTNRLVSAYMLYNADEDKYYEIIDAGVGKNQETGKIEHIELKVVQVEADEGCEDGE